MAKRTSPSKAAKNTVTVSRNVKPPIAIDHHTINAYILTIATVGLLAAAVGQIVVSIRQTSLVQAATNLQLAQAKPKVRIIPSSEEFRTSDGIGPVLPGSYVDLPVYFTVDILGGIDGIFSIDAPITIDASNDNGLNSCSIEVRGLYVENEDASKLELFSPPREDFSELIAFLHQEGIEFSYPIPRFIVRYYDIFGELRSERHNGRMFNSGYDVDQRTNALILYNGIWSNGSGLYFDDFSTPEQHCPTMATKIRAVIERLGGKVGDF